MALVALTDEQKQALLITERYKTLAYWAVVDEARFWNGQDGVSPPGGDRIKWAKSRYMSVNNILRFMNVPEEYYKLLLALHDIPVYDNAVPFDANIVLDYMVANGTFDTLAALAFDVKIKEILF